MNELKNESSFISNFMPVFLTWKDNESRTSLGIRKDYFVSFVSIPKTGSIEIFIIVPTSETILVCRTTNSVFGGVAI